MWDPNGTNAVVLSENSIYNFDLNDSAKPKVIYLTVINLINMFNDVFL